MKLAIAFFLAALFLAGCQQQDLAETTVAACPDSDTSPTVVLNGCDTTVVNKKVGECTLADVLRECESVPEEEFARCISGKTNTLMQQNVIAGQDKGNIQICAGDDREAEGEQPGEE